ncbi:hypothetical protein AAH450_19160 [Erwinia sp. P7711]|uniref:Uncharacterized protein n=1 Tax=Erwinia pyri TaxID=3062598 RepID=A0AA50DM30_9GAMM|nr:hypothetical protein [Erwinia sp. DE2]WLS79408.1 hypothetical protein Q3V30_02495 [Erwinia sp. DE2]
MTPTEAGVREYCANTREKGNLRYSEKKSLKAQARYWVKRSGSTLANPASPVTRFIKMCDVEQRFQTENINLITQSSGK